MAKARKGRKKEKKDEIPVFAQGIFTLEDLSGGGFI